MKHVLMLAPVPFTAAATRFRLSQFLPALRDAGIQATIRPFLNPRELSVLYSRPGPVQMAQVACVALGGRLRDLAFAMEADLIFVQRELALVGPPLLEWTIATLLQKPTVFDFDDAIWEPYSSPTYGPWLSRLVKMPQKTRFSVRTAKEVIAGNHYLAQYARTMNQRVTVIPTVVDTDVFTPQRTKNEIPVLGWIGSHSTVAYLVHLLPALARLALTHRFVLRVIGAKITAPGVPLDVRPWSLQNEVSDFQSLDIGLYPMTDDRWSRGKSGFKAVQYMACGVPVVASPVGPIPNLICDGENGFLARNEDEWVDRLKRLLDDSATMTKFGEAGRDTVATSWSLRKFAPVFVEVLHRAMS
jgi:glycosyltransferase involved in cell wall biosynthesis